jgi:cystathionine beta-lyase/cystathionine gamma-synthase
MIVCRPPLAQFQRFPHDLAGTTVRVWKEIALVTRPDRHDPITIGFATQAVHLGNTGDPGTGAIRSPIVMANSYALPHDPTAIDWSDSSAENLVYTRNSGANQLQLEAKLAALEQGEAAVVFGTGVAALHGIFFTLLRSGDHAVISDVTYEAVWRLFAELLPERYGIEATFVDITDHDAVRAAIRSNTKLIHTEVIANPTTEVADIAALAGIAHESGALLTVDGTFAPPPLYRPLADGADLVAHSLTKYINGHGDAMGGAVIGNGDLVARIKGDALVDVGGAISPFNAWLIMRGSVTLPLRLRQHQENAQAVAAFLASDSRVAYVYYPGLASHPQHEVATRQFAGRGYGGMLAFAVDGDGETQNRFVGNLRVITSAVSLGHDESLIVHVGPTGRGGSEHYPEPFRKYGHLRFSVGLEDADDLIADLAAALDATFAG